MKKLSLRRETLRSLSSNNLARAAGGTEYFDRLQAYEVQGLIARQNVWQVVGEGVEAALTRVYGPTGLACVI